MINTKSYLLLNIFLICLGLYSFFHINYWHWLPLFWLIRTIGNSIIGHRYFAHNQFEVGPKSRSIFAYYTSLCSYSTPIYWIIQHSHHHRNSDKISDIHSPTNGLLNSMGLWMFNEGKINNIFKDRSSKILLVKILKEKHLVYSSKWFVWLNVALYTTLFILNKEIFLLWSASYIIELIKLGLINSILHLNWFPGNYKNHKLADNSNNNIFLGFLTLGFGWHNNHHADAKKLNLKEKWWEIDIEGIIGRNISKICRF
jgi:fatty-acid desaturase